VWQHVKTNCSSSRASVVKFLRPSSLTQPHFENLGRVGQNFENLASRKIQYCSSSSSSSRWAAVVQRRVPARVAARQNKLQQQQQQGVGRKIFTTVVADSASLLKI